MSEQEPGHSNRFTGTAHGWVFQARDVHITRPAPVVPRQLPGVTARFVGREREMAALDELVDGGTAVITSIEGAAGIGKTALALRWAKRVRGEFPDGQLYVNLRGFDASAAPVEPLEALRGFLMALDVPESRMPSRLDDCSALYRSLVADRRVLVVLDNARDVAQVRPLLVGGRGAVVLVTTRTAFDGLVVQEGARRIRVGALDDGESRDLLAGFLGRERVAKESAVAELVALCGGLPLALSIVGAKGSAHPRTSAADLVRMVRAERNRLDALRTDDLGTDPSAVFSASYRDLSAGARRLFRLLTVSPLPTFGSALAASVVGEPQAPVEELASAHLVEAHHDGRYRTHDLLVAYAAELSRAEDTDADRAAAFARFTAHQQLSRAKAYGLLGTSMGNPGRRAAEPGVTVERLDTYAEALRWVEHDLVSHEVDLDRSPSPFVQDRQLAILGGRLGAIPLSTPRFMGPRGALLALANHRRGALLPERAMFHGSADATLGALAERVERDEDYMRNGSFYKKGLSRRMEGYVEHAWNLALLGRVDESAEQARWAIRFADEEQPLLPTVWFIVGYCRWAASDYAEAETSLSQALAGFTRFDARYDMATTLCFLAVVKNCAQDREAALRHAEAAREILGQIGHDHAAAVEELLAALTVH